MPLIQASFTKPLTPDKPRKSAELSYAGPILVALLLHIGIMAAMVAGLRQNGVANGVAERSAVTFMLTLSRAPGNAPGSASVTSATSRTAAMLNAWARNDELTAPRDDAPRATTLSSPSPPSQRKNPSGGMTGASPASGAVGFTDDPWAHASVIAEQTAASDPSVDAKLGACEGLDRLAQVRVLLWLDRRGEVSDVRRKDGAPLADGPDFSAKTVKMAVTRCGPFPRQGSSGQLLMATLGAGPKR